MRTSISPITYTELLNYFDVANDQLYDLLDSDTELHRIIYAIEVLQTSNRTLEELRARQEHYMLNQFELALQNGLHGQLSPMVVQQRDTTKRSTPPPHAMDGSDTRNNRPIQSSIHKDCACPRSLLERMSMPTMFSETTIPPSPSDSSFACEICIALHKMSINHYTPDCRQYICTICKKTQASHFPEDCPEQHA